MRTSEQLAELAAALAKAQRKIKGATRDSSNPFFKSRYADLASTWDACREALSENGLSVVQTCGGDDPEIVCVTTRLLHASGQWIEDTLKLRPVKSDPQGIGSATTYARRYSLAAIVGVAPEDDDGNAASAPKQEYAPKVTDKQAIDLAALIEETGAEREKFLAWAKIDCLENLPAADYLRAVKALEAKRKAPV